MEKDFTTKYLLMVKDSVVLNLKINGKFKDILKNQGKYTVCVLKKVHKPYMSFLVSML